jgi:D-alanyl-D-alanine carboxypeptidase (penicillin-binding protein 5/6)
MKSPLLNRLKIQIETTKISSRHVLGIGLITLAVLIAVMIPVMAFTPLGTSTMQAVGLLPPTPPPLVSFQMPRVEQLTVDKAPPEVQAQFAYLEDAQHGTILMNKQATKYVAIASTTKMMTALVAIQSGRLDCTVTIKQYILDHVIINNSSNAGLLLGDTFSVRELLPGLMLPSGGDAALAIAECLYGSEEQFVEQMNRMAQHLNLYHTHYNTVDGRDEPENYATAIDMAHLAAYALNVPEFAEVVKQSSYILPANADHATYKWKNTNNLLVSYDGMLGVKTGHTERSGYCLIFAARRNGQFLIGAVFNSPDITERDNDARTILDWGFSLPVKAVS